MTAVLPISAEPAAMPRKTPGPAAGAGCRPRPRWARSCSACSCWLHIIGPFVAPYDPSFQNPSPALPLHAPYGAHLLGTTQSGQDVLSQLLAGIRLTLELAFFVGLVATVLSVIVGVTAAFLGGVLGRGAVAAHQRRPGHPALPLLIVLLGYWQTKGQTATILVLSLLGWPWGARVVRAQTLAIRNRDFIAAARETGEQTWRIITLEIVPNEVSLIAASFVNTVLYAIGASVALAFIGVTNLNSWSLGHHALLGAEPAGAAARGLVVVHPAGAGRGAHRHRPGPAEHRDRRARQPAAARRGQRQPDRRALAPPADPTPVLSDVSQRRGCSWLTSCTRSPAARSLTTPGRGRPMTAESRPGPDPGGHVAPAGPGPGARDPGPVGSCTARRAATSAAVDKVNLSLAPGEVVGLAGESGSGKSTLVYGATRLLRAPALVTSGERHLCRAPRDQARRPAPAAAGRAAAAALAGDRHRVPERDERAEPGAQRPRSAARRHPRPPADAAGRGQGAGRVRCSTWWASRASRLRSYPHELSGGMRQRVMIAMALATDPEVVIMDEPTTALDVVVQRDILAQIVELQRAARASPSLFITHDLSLLLELADRIAVMYAGQLLETGTAAEIHRDRRTRTPRACSTRSLAPRPAPRPGWHPRLTARPARPAARLPVPRRAARTARRRARRSTCTCCRWPRPGPGARDGLPVRRWRGTPVPATGRERAGQEHRRGSRRDRAGDHADVRRRGARAAAPWRRSRSARTSRSAAARSLHAVRDVSFNLYRGAVVALVGESGSGQADRRPAAGRAGTADLRRDQAGRQAGRGDVAATISAAARARSSTSSRTRSPR